LIRIAIDILIIICSVGGIGGVLLRRFIVIVVAVSGVVALRREGLGDLAGDDVADVFVED
jgi:hypothetical protein